MLPVKVWWWCTGGATGGFGGGVGPKDGAGISPKLKSRGGLGKSSFGGP